MKFTSSNPSFLIAYVEGCQVVHNIRAQGVVSGVVGDPGIVESLRRGRSSGRLEGQHPGDESLGLVADGIPVWIIKRKFPDFDLVHNLQISSAIKGWVPAQKDVEDDPTAPDITFLIIIPRQDLRGDVVRLTKLIPKNQDLSQKTALMGAREPRGADYR